MSRTFLERLTGHGSNFGEARGLSDKSEGDRAKRLWGAVLLEQWRLAFGCDATGMKTAVPPKGHEIDAARRWFGSRDFEAVCDLAGVDPVPVYVEFLHTLEAARAGELVEGR